MAKEHQSCNKINYTCLTIYVAFVCQFEINGATAIECGTKFVTRPRIKGGSQTVRGEWPFVVALYEIKPSKYFCGGTLISNKHVLTAAHCIQAKYSSIKLSPDELEARIGAYNLTSNSDGDVIARNVSETYVHPDWEVYDFRYDADLAILALSDNVTFTNYIQPVCMPADDEIIDGGTIDMKGHIVGWGLAKNVIHEAIPRQAVTNAFNDSYCYRTDFGIIAISSARTFCGGDGEGVPANGDSGGGFCVLPGLAWVQYGIISSSRTNSTGHITENAFAVYTNVKMFKEWIVTTVTQSGGEVGEAIRVHKIDLNCDYTYTDNQQSHLVNDETWQVKSHVYRWYTCSLENLDIRRGNIEVASVGGSHYYRQTADDVTRISFTSGTVLYLPDGVGNFFRNVTRVEITSSLRTRFLRRSNVKNFEKLVNFKIFENDIETLDDDLLWDLSQLEHFQLSGNKIKVISAKMFERNFELRMVGLHSNQLEALPANLFQHNLLLEQVLFDGNALKTLDEHLFSNNLNLNAVSFSVNRIEILPKNLFGNNLLLKSINFSNNSLTTIDDGIFVNNTELMEVFFEYNKLEFLPRNLFLHNLFLQLVDFRNNDLKIIDIDFRGFKHFEYLIFLNNVCVDAFYHAKTDQIFQNEVRHLDEFQDLISCNCTTKLNSCSYERTYTFLLTNKKGKV